MSAYASRAKITRFSTALMWACTLRTAHVAHGGGSGRVSTKVVKNAFLKSCRGSASIVSATRGGGRASSPVSSTLTPAPMWTSAISGLVWRAIEISCNVSCVTVQARLNSFFSREGEGVGRGALASCRSSGSVSNFVCDGA